MAVLLVSIVLGYLALGVLVGSAFAWRGAAAIDPNARGTGFGFRLLIIPGSAALWPLALVKWRRSLAAGSGVSAGGGA